MGTLRCYLDPDTGTLSSDPRPGSPYLIEDTVPGVRAPLVLCCGLHRRYEAVDTVVSIFATDPGLTHVAGLVRSSLAATCTTCGEWRMAVHRFQAALGTLRISRAADGLRQDDRLLLPMRSHLAIGQVLNSPEPLPDALAALAGMALHATRQRCRSVPPRTCPPRRARSRSAFPGSGLPTGAAYCPKSRAGA